MYKNGKISLQISNFPFKLQLSQEGASFPNFNHDDHTPHVTFKTVSIAKDKFWSTLPSPFDGSCCSTHTE